MNIGIDARMYGLENAGIGRYIINLTRELFILDKTNTYTLFLRSKYARILKVPKNVNKVTANFRHYSLLEQTKFPKLIEKYKVDLMHFPHFNVPLLYNKHFVVTIHDLLWHKTKGLAVTSLSPFKYALKYFAYRAVVNHAIDRAQAIMVPSEYVKKDVVGYGANKKLTTVTYEGVDDHLSTTKTGSFNEFAKKWKIAKPFVIYTGSAYPHKNVKTLIEAIAELQVERKTGLNLVIVSSRTIFLDKLKKYVQRHKLTNLVKFTGYLTDKEVKTLYREAVALVHPSLSEGFGLTGLEAMSVGLPVVSSNSASLPEIYGTAASYFNPKSRVDLEEKLNTIVTDEAMRKILSQAGRERVKDFSWKKMAMQCLEIYQKTSE